MRQALGTPSSGAIRSWNRALALELLFLAMVVWVVHYFLFRSMGLYEDDYAYIGRSLGWNLSDVLDYLRVFLTWPQGRPLGFFLPHFIAFLDGKLGDLSAMYLLACVVQTTNAFLFYFLLRRLDLGPVAWIGAIIFGLFPADTTHTFLMHSFGLHTSLSFLLVASHLYLSGRKPFAYLVSLLCLLTYESPYAVFLAVPLLCRTWDRKLTREIVRHIAAWLGILLVVVLVRAVLGESRIENVGASSTSMIRTLGQILAAFGIGPAVSLAMFAFGPGWTVFHWNPSLTVVCLGSLPLFAWLLIRSDIAMPLQKSRGFETIQLTLFGRPATPTFRLPEPRTFQLVLTALIMLILAYSFSFTHFPPTARYGRMTSVHLAAAFGGALLFACLSFLFLALVRSRRYRKVGLLILALYLSLLAAYRFSIQQDFVKAWQNEQAFWKDVLAKNPDLSDGTVIFVLDRHLPTTHFIMTNSWADPIVLEQIFQFPAEWKAPPRLFVVSPDWTDSVILEGGNLEWEVPQATLPPHREALPDANLVLMDMRNGVLVRRFKPIVIQGRTLQLKPRSLNAEPDINKGALYSWLIPGTK